jgi:hypothetical protein
MGRYATNEVQPKHFAQVAHGRSLLLASSPYFGKPKEADLSLSACHLAISIVSELTDCVKNAR